MACLPSVSIGSRCSPGNDARSSREPVNLQDRKSSVGVLQFKLSVGHGAIRVTEDRPGILAGRLVSTLDPGWQDKLKSAVITSRV